MAFILALILVGVSASFLGAAIASRRTRSAEDPELRELRERVSRLEQALESATGELEKVAESQRFLTALLEDRAKSHPALKGQAGEAPR